MSDGTNKENQVDLIAFNDNKLILIECKNYLGHTPPREFVISKMLMIRYY